VKIVTPYNKYSFNYFIQRKREDSM